jgi:hypothetical protein
VKVYHVTSLAPAEAIDLEGFLDAVDSYMTSGRHTGVWISDRPLDGSEGTATPQVVYELEVDEDLIRQYEWIEEGKPYREWLVPASILNGAERRRLGMD